VSASKAGTVVQGGTFGPAKAAASGSTTSSSASPSASTKSAGVESRGQVQWVVAALTGVLAVGVGSLMV
jgi:hypothetical protein